MTNRNEVIKRLFNTDIIENAKVIYEDDEITKIVSKIDWNLELLITHDNKSKKNRNVLAHDLFSGKWIPIF